MTDYTSGLLIVAVAVVAFLAGAVTVASTQTANVSQGDAQTALQTLESFVAQHPDTTTEATSTTTSSTTSSTTTPSTTTTSTTMVMPTTTTTVTPPGTFTDNFEAGSAAFLAGYDMGYSGYYPINDPSPTILHSWLGDHDLNCGGPDTKRTIQLTNIPSMFYWCAPMGAGSGHVMTALGSTGYVEIWFSPKQYFSNVKRVCWDQNMTMQGGREWTQVMLAGRADVERVQAAEGHLDLGFSHPGFQDLNGPTTGVIPTDATLGVNAVIGTLHLWKGTHTLGDDNNILKTEDLMTRFHQCMKDNGNGTITLTRTRADGTSTATYAGSFPTGDVRVVFDAATYDGPKDAEYDPNQNTWHWDDVLIQS